MNIEGKHVLLFLAIAILMAATAIGIGSMQRDYSGGVSTLGEYGESTIFVGNVKLEEGDGNVVITPNDAHNGLEFSLESPLTDVLIGSGDRLSVGTELNFEQSDGTSLYYHHHPLSAYAISPGASGAAEVAPSANGLGGWNLDVDTEELYFNTHVNVDWDGVSDMLVEVTFELNAAGTDGADTVDLQLVSTYKGDGEAVIKTQTDEVAMVVGTAAQWTQFETVFVITYNPGGGQDIESNDKFAWELSLETDTSEVDDITVNFVVFKYESKKPTQEVP